MAQKADNSIHSVRLALLGATLTTFFFLTLKPTGLGQCPLPETIIVTTSTTTSAPTDFEVTYCVNVAAAEFYFGGNKRHLVPPAELHEIAKVAILCVKSYALSRMQNGAITSGTDSQVCLLDNTGNVVALPQNGPWEFLYEVAEELRGVYIASDPEGNPASCEFARRVNDLYGDNTIADNRSGYGRHGNGYAQIPGNTSQASGVHISSLGQFDWESHPRGVGQYNTFTEITGKPVGDNAVFSASSILPTQFDGINYCKKSAYEVLSNSYSGDWRVTNCTNGSSVELSTYTPNCTTNNPLPFTAPNNTERFRWYDYTLIHPVDIQHRVTGSTTSGSDVVNVYSVVANTLLAGRERVYRFTATSSFRLRAYLTDLSSQQKLRLIITNLPGPLWSRTSNWVDNIGNDAYLEADIVAGTDYYLWVDSPTGAEGDFEIHFSQVNLNGTIVPISGSTYNSPGPSIVDNIPDPNEWDTERKTLQGTTSAHTTNNSSMDAMQSWEFEYIGRDFSVTGTTIGVITSGDIDWFKIPCKYGGVGRVTLTGSAGQIMELQNGAQTVSGTITGTTTGKEIYIPAGGVLYIKVSGAIGSFTLRVKWTPGPPPCTLTATTSITGSGPCTRTIIASPANGTAPYTYAWNTGATSSSIIITQTGTYIVTVTDAAGCTVAKTRQVILGGTPPTATIQQQVHDDCSTSEHEGRILLKTMNMGTTPIFTWSDGVITGRLRTGMSAGIYGVTITGNGCSIVISSINMSATNCGLITLSLRDEDCSTLILQPQLHTALPVAHWHWVTPHAPHPQVFTWECPVSATGTYTLTATLADGTVTSATYNVADEISGLYRPLPGLFGLGYGPSNGGIAGLIAVCNLATINGSSLEDIWWQQIPGTTVLLDGVTANAITESVRTPGAHEFTTIYSDGCLVTQPYTVTSINTDTWIPISTTATEQGTMLRGDLGIQGIPLDEMVMVYEWSYLHTDGQYHWISLRYTDSGIAELPEQNVQPGEMYKVVARPLGDLYWTLEGTYTVPNNLELRVSNTMTRGATIWPNPTTDVLNIQGAGGYELLSSDGAQIARGMLSKSVNTLHLNNQPAGIYWLKVTNTNESVTYKVIKQ